MFSVSCMTDKCIALSLLSFNNKKGVIQYNAIQINTNYLYLQNVFKLYLNIICKLKIQKLFVCCKFVKKNYIYILKKNWGGGSEYDRKGNKIKCVDYKCPKHSALPQRQHVN